MVGKIIKFNDYKLTYGTGTVYLNVYAAFKSTKSGNKYIIYSYDNMKLYMGSLFVRNNELVVMSLKDDNKNEVKEFVSFLLENKTLDNFEIISLENIVGIQVIDESIYTDEVDINKLNDLTIPKPEVIVEEKVKPKKRISIAYVFFCLFILVVAAFFFVNPEVIMGKDKKYSCIKNYQHEKIPVNVEEEVNLLFDGKDKIKTMNIEYAYVFSDSDYYSEFKSKNYEYQYFKVNATYHHTDSINYDDDTHTCKLLSDVLVDDDGYFMPKKLNELISYYQEKDYKCNEIEIE